MTQAAISHQVKGLEDLLGTPLFRRLPRGLALTDEGLALVPVLTDTFSRIALSLERFAQERVREVVTLGCVGTFATGWLLEQLGDFESRHPHVDLRLLTNNNRVDIAGDGLDFALRFGDGSWHGAHATHLIAANLAPLCTLAMAARLRHPADLARERLLRSYRVEEWPLWFAMAQTACPAIRGPIFDNSITMVEAACQGVGVALAPVGMFQRELAAGHLVRPFDIHVAAGSYWLTWLTSKPQTPGMQLFQDWLTSRLRHAAPMLD